MTHRMTCLPSAARRALWALAIVASTQLAAFAPSVSEAQCVLVRERGGPTYSPHLTIHFGDREDVPARVQCSTSVDKRVEWFCVPLYAYNLWEGAVALELGIETPLDPLGFDRGPNITRVQMEFDSRTHGTFTSISLEAESPLCGPAYLGCLRLPTSNLPEDFAILVGEHSITGRRSIQTELGQWRSLAVSEHAAHVGPTLACLPDPCELNAPVERLEMQLGSRPGMVEFEWSPGSGSYTLLRYRRDGLFPSNPWDGELLAFLPSSITNFSQYMDISGDVHVAAWSIERNSQGNLLAASNVECGSLGSVTLHLPIAVESHSWQQVKTLYR